MRVNFKPGLAPAQVAALERVGRAMFQLGKIEGDLEEQEFLRRAQAKLSDQSSGQQARLLHAARDPGKS